MSRLDKAWHVIPTSITSVEDAPYKLEVGERSYQTLDAPCDGCAFCAAGCCIQTVVDGPRYIDPVVIHGRRLPS